MFTISLLHSLPYSASATCVCDVGRRSKIVFIKTYRCSVAIIDDDEQVVEVPFNPINKRRPCAPAEDLEGEIKADSVF